MHTMSALSLFKSKKDRSVVLDFGPSAVKGLLLERGEKHNTIIKFWLEEVERFGVFNGGEFELEIMKKAAEKVIKNLGFRKEIVRLPMLLGFSPDILKAAVFEVSFPRENGAEKIGKAEQDRIYELAFMQARKKLFRIVKQRYKQEPTDLQILRERVLENKIAGYKVQSLIGFRGKDLSFRVLVVFVLRAHSRFLQELIDSLGLKDFKVLHLAEGLIRAKNLMNESAQVFLDIGARASQFFSFAPDIQFISEFRVGGYDFSKVLWEHFGLTQNEAEILKKRLSESKFSAKAAKKIKEVLAPIFELWAKSFQERFKEKAKASYFFPQRIWVFGGGSLLPGIKTALKNKDFGDVTSSQEPKVDFLDIEKLPLKNKTGTSLDARAIPALLLSLGH